jgi:hypothetical protein
MDTGDELDNDLFTLTVNLETELSHLNRNNISTIVSGQRDSSGQWERVEIQLANDDNEIIFERVYPNRPSYNDVRDDYGPLKST